MERNIRRLGYIAVVRATGQSLVLPYVALYLRNVLGIGFVQIGLLLAALGVAPLLLVPFGGLVADRLGRKPLVVAALFAEAVAILLVGVSMLLGSTPGVIGAALAVSLAGALGGPALSAYVADLASGADRTRGFTYIRIGWNVGFAFGVFSGGELIAAVGFPGVGILAGAVLIASSITLALVLEPSPFDRERARSRATPGVGTVYGPPLRASLKLLAGDRVFLVVCLCAGVANLAVAQWATTFPLYVNAVLHVPYAILGAGFALNGVLVVLAQAPTTRAAIGHRHTSLILLGVLLYVGGFLFLGAVALVPALLVVGFFVAVVVLTMGENVLSIPSTTLQSNLAPPREVGAYNGAFAAIVGAGQVLAPTLGGVVVAAGLPPPVTWAILMVPAFPALAVLRLWVVPRILDRPNRA